MSQEERSRLWEVMVSVILSKNLYIYVCPIPTGFWSKIMVVIVRIKERQDALRGETRHVLTRITKCIDADGRIFQNVINRANIVIWTINTNIRNGT
jgi:predicted metal-dependent peptidase